MAQNPILSMTNRVFGFMFRRNTDPKMPSPVAPNTDDGAVMVGAPNQFGYWGNASGKVETNLTEYQLITRYREMARHHLLDWAINEVTNETIVQDGEVPAVALDLIDCEQIEDEFKEIILEEFAHVLKLLNWEHEAYEVFRNFYIDGRLYYQMLPFTDTTLGLQELRYIDPRQIKKFIEIEKKVDQITKIEYQDVRDEFYVYAPFGIDYNGTTMIPSGTNPIVNGVRLTKDSICFIHSNRFDPTNSVILSYLDKAIRPLSQLKSMENATLIYKLARCTERRVWKIPTGTMPEKQVGTYLDKIVAQYRSKTAYDAISGDVVDERRVLAIIDDIFIPIPSSGEAVQVDTIPGGSGFDDTSTLDFFNKNLLQAINVPPSRLQQDAIALFGNTGMVSRDERQFAKLIWRLRDQFERLFCVLLTTQLRLKGVVQDEETMDYLLAKMKFKWATDNYYTEMSEASVVQARVANASEMQPLVGKYYSNKWVKTHILKQTDEEQIQMQKEIEEEIESGEIQPPMEVDPATGLPIDPATGQVQGWPEQAGPMDPNSQAPGTETYPIDDAAEESDTDRSKLIEQRVIKVSNLPKRQPRLSLKQNAQAK